LSAGVDVFDKFRHCVQGDGLHDGVPIRFRNQHCVSVLAGDRDRVVASVNLG